MAFRSVNTALAQESHMRAGEEANPSTPRPSTAPHMPSHAPRDDATTPTRANFGSLASQRPLPTNPFPSDIAVPSSASSEKHSCLHRGDSQHSTKSRDSEDVDMDDSEEGEEGSDDESVNADGTRSSKKKKSQRFYCTDYPPCNLSFTRSEHLARHIRKHTGERPFQCHCSRRFSRLDNLRQHAQTVHQNEDIPQDSLAATGTRFQRQVRTERIRPPGNRSRANSTQSGPVRGHQRNSLSTSSITSMTSGYSQASDLRRRPPPLVTAGRDPQARYSQEMYRPESPNSQYGYRQQSPGAFGTPTSATFSTGHNSPRWGSAMQSPMASHARTRSLHGSRTPGRRLSVPSSGNPFQSPHGSAYGPPVLSQLNASSAGTYSPSSNMVSSPTSSTAGSTWSRRDSITSASDEAWRRRTWHPETYTNFTSRLQQVTTPNYYSNGPLPQPPVVPSNAPPLQPANAMRLPGIESFDPLPPRTSSPLRREPSPMMIDTPSRIPPQRDPYIIERPGSQHWDMGINRNLNRLDIGRNSNDNASSWASEVNNAVQARVEETRAQPTVRFEESPYSARVQQGERAFHQHTISAPPITPRSAKRQGWYAGPLNSPPGPITQHPISRTSPVDSSSSDGGPPATPQTSMVEPHPAILRSNGWMDQRDGSGIVSVQHEQHNTFISYPPPPSVPEYQYPPRPPHEQRPSQSEGNNMRRLEALVAVATAKSSEENGAIHA